MGYSKTSARRYISACQADRKALARLAASLDAPICVEVGAYIGHTALAMLAGGARHVYSVDLWNGDTDSERLYWRADPDRGLRVFDEFCRRVSLFESVTPVVGDSLFWAARWPFKIDLVFIDADHAYEPCRADIAAWWPHIKPSGILCGHDFCDSFPGVIRAVQESGPYKRVGQNVWWRRK